MKLENTWQTSGLEKLISYIIKAANQPEILDDLNYATDATWSSNKIKTVLDQLKLDIDSDIDGVAKELSKIKIELVTVEPTNDNTVSGTIYIYQNTTDNKYYQYLRTETVLVNLGEASAYLTKYYTKTDADAKFALASDLTTTNTEVAKKLNKTSVIASTDTTTAAGEDNVYSAKKVDSLIEEVDPSSLIDDTTASDSSTYSSEKIEDIVNKHVVYCNYFPGLTLEEIYTNYASQNTKYYQGYLNWQDSRVPNNNTLFISCCNWSMYGNEISTGYRYIYDSTTKSWKPLAKYSNPNLLDNPWFTVNQRGKSEYADNGNTYSVDRWILQNQSGNAKFEVIPDSNNSRWITTEINDGLLQPVNPLTIGETYTISFNSGYKIFTSTFIWKGTDIVKLYDGASTTNFAVIHDSTHDWVYPYVRYAGLASKSIKAVKLELGSVSTLANDVPPNYATELAKCQRYYQRIISSSATANTYYTLGYAISKQGVEWNIQYPVEMRAEPTVTWDATKINYTILGNNAANSVPFTDAPAAGVPFTGYDGGTKMMYFRCNDNTNKPFTVGQPVQITFTPNTVIELSADL